ncbi:potassium/proton antiporter [uncultured Eubacterium sp.]|uniref:potassium/proton antiporter n=1 Tax=uncultured Eubacterium sp. TaxID=165185 RepID=UPI002595E939|nr:potassium/proton antiporter [uncultured Eubacterium sp.]
MNTTLILIGIVLLLSIVADKFSIKLGMPALILFMGIGMLFGCDGLLKIPFSNYYIAEEICSVALCLIMFYGGFNTKWSTAKATAPKAIALSTVGILITAFLTGTFCFYVLNFSFIESYLIGAVLSSTDAASVFSILRKKKLNLKDGSAPLLEIESGSNDPFAYLLTIIGISILNGESLSKIPYVLFSQLFFGIVIGFLIAYIGIILLTKTTIVPEGLDTIFVISLIVITFGLSSLINGNGFLAIYILGILLGNHKFSGKKTVISFFDGLTALAQILIFFLLGLLAFPHNFPQIILPSMAIVCFLTLIARPVAVFIVLKPFKSTISQCLLISWAGLRGAASIVFSIMVVAGNSHISFDIFHIVFMVALFSVAIQGTLLPLVSEKLHMVDNSNDVRKTFNDYQEESSITLMRMFIPPNHNWVNRNVSDVNMPTDSLALMIKRNGNTIIPNGDTLILANDTVILSVPSYEPSGRENLKEMQISKKHKWCNKKIQELNLPTNVLIALVKRGSENLIPDGSTTILENDIIVLYK